MSVEGLQQAIALHKAGRLEEAEARYRAILAQAPKSFDALHYLGVLAAQRGRVSEGADLIGKAIELNPRVPDAQANLANLYNQLGRAADALAACDRALEARPDHAEAHNTRAVALLRLGRHADALASADRALAANPRHAIAHSNRGAALAGLRRIDEAIASFDGAVALHPNFAQAWRNRGDAYRVLARHREAVESDTRALALEPDHLATLVHRGHSLHCLARNDAAARDFARAVQLDPKNLFAWSMLSMVQRHNAAWNDADVARAKLVEAVRDGRPVEPFPFFVQTDSPEDQRRCAELAAASVVPPSASPLWQGERYAHDRVRIAYLSADFREHATAYLLAEVIERHDRARFHVTGLSWCPDEPTPMRARMKRAFETFVEVQQWTDENVARWMRQHEIDIAVDLMGYANGARPGIFARRPAPVQVNYLGYPGTLGAPQIDYILADATVIPPESQRHYAERVVYLPDTYQPNDRQRPIPADAPPREACGLPPRGFVFASFNGTYKITPAVFDVWMRLLTKVDDSVLWLLSDGETAVANLRREAQVRGVAPGRLVFAPRLPLAGHLARQRHADLLLDTLPCNAHTTASDALWAGVPVLTCLGRTFAGRVAGSLVRAAELPELVVSTLDEYEATAQRLALDREALRELRARLAARRMSCALFDSERYARHLEAAWATMSERTRAGLPPEGFAVAAE
jgi:predicted O-linked N-acetylglucosamine transferase (SPINDLY family)